MTTRNLSYVLVGLALGLVGSTISPLHAQRPAGDPPAATLEERPSPPLRTEGKVSLQEALLRPYSFDFTGPTPLSKVAARLADDLGGAVVLDLAALERLGVSRGDTVELELRGARLKTGLRLLLDQLDLTYRIVPEDNLLIITDREGSTDPIDQVWAELDHIHRDIHDIQGGVEELRELLGVDLDGGAQLRRPTIIEEMPGAEPNELLVPDLVPDSLPDDDEPAPVPAPTRPRTSL